MQSPALYEEEIRVQEPGMVAERGIYRSNDTDLVAAAAALLGLASIATWFGGGLCLPLAAGVLGLAALTSRRKGLNPARAQWMGVFGTGMGLLGLLPLVFFICIFAFSLGLAVAGAAGGP